LVVRVSLGSSQVGVVLCVVAVTLLAVVASAKAMLAKSTLRATETPSVDDSESSSFSLDDDDTAGGIELLSLPLPPPGSVTAGARSPGSSSQRSLTRSAHPPPPEEPEEPEEADARADASRLGRRLALRRVPRRNRPPGKKQQQAPQPQSPPQPPRPPLPGSVLDDGQCAGMVSGMIPGREEPLHVAL
jgi:hypothetical protein